jgi:hypothetical protein
MENVILSIDQIEVVGVTQNENPQVENQWYCDACGGNSDSGCLSTTGECYR